MAVPAFVYLSAERRVRIGPVLVLERSAEPAYPHAAPPWFGEGDQIAICFPLAGELHLLAHGEVQSCRPGAVLIAHREAGTTMVASHDAVQITLVAAASFLTEVCAGLHATDVVAGNISFDLLLEFARQLLAHGAARLSPNQAMLAATALRHLLAAALVPVAGPLYPAARRRDGLLNRLTALLDSRLDHDWDVTELCAALGRSRSALYRATEPVNGIVELLARRRLVAIHRTLLDPADPRTIAEIAAAFGFPDAGQFSRRFKQSFGTTPGRVRRGAARRADPLAEAAFDPFARLSAGFAPVSDAAGRR